MFMPLHYAIVGAVIATAGFPEWLKILLTALAAFAVGVVTEPLKLIISNRYKMRNMRRSLYSELANNYGHLSMFLREEARPVEDFYLFCETEGFPTDAYRWAKSQLDVFYQLEEAGVLDNIYRNLEWAFSSVGDMEEQEEQEDPDTVYRALLAMSIFEKHISEGNLKLKLFRSVSRQAYKLFEDLKNARIESAQDLINRMQSRAQEGGTGANTEPTDHGDTLPTS